MSGSALGNSIIGAIKTANGTNNPAPAGPPPPGMAMPQPGLQTPIPLASMLANNATALQMQNPTQPWYAIPGMFRQPPPPPVAPPPAAAPPSSSAPVDYTTFLNPAQQEWQQMMTTGTQGQQDLAKQAYQVAQNAMYNGRDGAG